MAEVIDQKMVTVDGKVYLVMLMPDHCASPHNADCYIAEDIAAWRNSEWQYVMITILDSDNEHVDSLSGVEYGDMSPDLHIDLDRIIRDHVTDMLNGR
jgi:hypothetical protein